MIQILFSLTFDKGAWTGAIQNGSAQVGRIGLGELGLLDLLETQLGLKQPDSPMFQRKIDYLQALRAADKKSNFYSDSLVTDPMAVTEHLLDLRDTLIESNWKKSEVAKLKKIEDLSEVEKHFSNKSGKADRLVLVLKALSDLKSFNSIESLSVIDDKDCLRSIWASIICEQLPRLGVKVTFLDPLNHAQAHPDSDLGKFVQLRKKESDAIGDDSLIVLTGRDPWESARFVASFLAKSPVDVLNDTVIVAPERQRGILMSAMLSQGIPFGGGHSEASYSRPALQILILSLALCWDPKDPSIALSLLTIEGSPVPKSFRYALVRSLNDSLAVGGKTWSDSLEEITESLIAKAETEEEKGKIAARGQRIKTWFSSPAFSFEKGLPVSELVATCKRASDWLRQKWVLSEQSSFREAYELCELLANLAKNLGETTISRERMTHLLIDSIGDGITADGQIAQSGGPRIVSNPRDIAAPVGHVIWWDFSSANVHGHHETFFSLNEIDELKTSKIFWPDPEILSISNARHWATPFLRAKKSVVLVSQLLDSDGNPEALHPALSELLPKKQRQEWMSVIHVNLLEKQSKASQRFLARVGAKQEKEATETFLPQLQWNVKKDSLSLRGAESASSLEQLLGCELAYVLRYQAGLVGEDRSSLQYDARIMGIIAHEVISLVFKEGPHPKPSSALSTAQNLIDDVIKDKAPQLFQKERSRELADLKRTVLHDIEVYASFLEKNDLSIEAAELDVKKSEKTLAGVHLVGKIDHILTDLKNSQIIIDHKWGAAKYKERDLNEGRSLQLALYSKLVSGAKEPTLAYHMITDSKILVLNSDFEKSQRVNGPEASEILLEAESQLRKKIGILKSGNLTAPGLNDDNESERFEAPCKYCDFGRICGLAWKV